MCEQSQPQPLGRVQGIDCDVPLRPPDSAVCFLRAAGSSSQQNEWQPAWSMSPSGAAPLSM